MKYIKYTLIFVAFILLNSCDKSFIDVNKNPNQLVTATPNFVLASALNNTTRTLVLANETGHYFSAEWTQSNSYILSPAIFAYSYTDGDFNYWDPFYDNLEDYQYVINNADNANQPYLKGPAKVMKALVFQYLVDMYGDIPYTDALKDNKSLAPKFDNQQDVYKSLIILLDDAITDLKANTFDPAFTSSDIVFKGNKLSWIAFANSLKLRILIHQSKIVSLNTYIKTEINKIFTEGSGVVETDVAVNPGYSVGTNQTNPFYDRFGYTITGATQGYGRFPRISKNLFDLMVSANDTFRIKRIAYAKGGENTGNPGTSVATELISNYVAVPYGVSSGYTAPSTSYIGPSVLVKNQYNKPFIVFQSSEAYFLLAEAKERFADISFSQTSQSYYETAVKKSFATFGSTSSAATLLLASGKVNADWSASSNKLEAIATQKWISFTNFSGIEAWTEYRRTNLPVIPQSAAVSDANKRPLRFFIPNTETGSNVNAKKVSSTIDVFATKIFWDVD